ncbi:MAG: hypothetical protein M3O03_14100 [Pseudomonadota bacterium]|nr:hypothetical protein [Pseudomonadota bacterium]
MKIIQEVAAELFSMFMADARMTIVTLILVAMAAAALSFISINSVWIGAALLVGCLVNVVVAAAREKRLRAMK